MKASTWTIRGPTGELKVTLRGWVNGRAEASSDRVIDFFSVARPTAPARLKRMNQSRSIASLIPHATVDWPTGSCH